MSKPQAAGHLHFLWWWAVDYAPDGDLSHFTEEDIAEGAGCDAALRDDAVEFVEALRTAGFIDTDDDGNLHIHDWADYAGRLIKRREDNSERKRIERGASRPADIHATAAATEQTIQTEPTGQTEPDGAVPPKRMNQVQLLALRRSEQITNDWCDEMVALYEGDFIGRGWVRGTIEQACGADNALKHLKADTEHGLQTWIENAWLKAEMRRRSEKLQPAAPPRQLASSGSFSKYST